MESWQSFGFQGLWEAFGGVLETGGLQATKLPLYQYNKHFLVNNEINALFDQTREFFYGEKKILIFTS